MENGFIDGAFLESLNSQLSRAPTMTLSSVPPTIEREMWAPGETSDYSCCWIGWPFHYMACPTIQEWALTPSLLHFSLGPSLSLILQSQRDILSKPKPDPGSLHHHARLSCFSEGYRSIFEGNSPFWRLHFRNTWRVFFSFCLSVGFAVLLAESLAFSLTVRNEVFFFFQASSFSISIVRIMIQAPTNCFKHWSRTYINKSPINRKTYDLVQSLSDHPASCWLITIPEDSSLITEPPSSVNESGPGGGFTHLCAMGSMLEEMGMGGIRHEIKGLLCPLLGDGAKEFSCQSLGMNLFPRHRHLVTLYDSRTWMANIF